LFDGLVNSFAVRATGIRTANDDVFSLYHTQSPHHSPPRYDLCRLEL